MRSEILKQTLKKIYKCGMFHSFVYSENYLSFRDVHGNMYTVNSPNSVGYWFRIGRVHSYTELAPTYESGYNAIGKVERAAFIDHIKPIHTDNPDYITKVALKYLLN